MIKKELGIKTKLQKIYNYRFKEKINILKQIKNKLDINKILNL